VALGHPRNWAFSFLRLPRSPARPLARSFPARICTNFDYTSTNCGGKFAQKLTSSIRFVAVFFIGFFCYLGHVMEEEDENNNPKTEVDCRNKYISSLSNVQHTQQTHSRITTTSTSSRKEEEEQQAPQQQQQQQQVAPAEEEFVRIWVLIDD
jgi:hypothetical protein